MVGVLIIFLIGMILMAVWQIIPLFREKLWGEIAVFSFLWLSAAFYASLIILKAPLPTVIEVIRPVLVPLYRFLGVEVSL